MCNTRLTQDRMFREQHGRDGIQYLSHHANQWEKPAKPSTLLRPFF
jgi:hypothetical protein